MASVRQRPRPTIHFPVDFSNAGTFSRKRKRAGSASSSEGELAGVSFTHKTRSPSTEEDEVTLLPPAKRLRRTTHLENGMADMKIRTSLVAASATPYVFPPAAAAAYGQGSAGAPSASQSFDSIPDILVLDQDYLPRDHHGGDDVLYGEVEEVISPAVRQSSQGNDVKMKGTSWYEPEKDRIVITDMDGSDDEEEDGPATPRPFKISSAYFAKMNRSPFDTADSVPFLDENRMALVAYRPLVQEIDLRNKDMEQPHGYIEEIDDDWPTEQQADEDAMDVDMED